MLFTEALDLQQDRLLLFLTKGNDAQRSLRIFFYMFFNKLHDSFRFENIVIARGRLIEAIFNVDELYPCIRITFITAWESHKIVFINLLIGEGNQMFMPASVMPAQRAVRKNISRFLKYRVIDLIIAVIIVVFFIDIAGICSKEICRRQLFCIACNNHLFCPEDSSDRILREYLRSLIEDDHIKLILLCIQEICNGKRRHHQTGLQREKQCGDALKEPAERHDPAFFIHLMTKYCEFGTSSRDLVQIRIRADDPLSDRFSGNLILLNIQFHELSETLFVNPSAKCLHSRNMIQLQEQPLNIKTALKCLLDIGHRIVPFGNFRRKICQPALITFFSGFRIVKPFIQFYETIRTLIIMIRHGMHAAESEIILLELR